MRLRSTGTHQATRHQHLAYRPAKGSNKKSTKVSRATPTLQRTCKPCHSTAVDTAAATATAKPRIVNSANSTFVSPFTAVCAAAENP